MLAIVLIVMPVSTLLYIRVVAQTAVLTVVATPLPRHHYEGLHQVLVVSLCCSNISSHFSRVFRSRFSRRNWKLDDGHLVDGGNVRIHAAAVATAAIKSRITYGRQD